MVWTQRMLLLAAYTAARAGIQRFRGPRASLKKSDRLA